METIVQLAVAFLVFICWANNLITLYHCGAQANQVIFRMIGIVAFPFGALFGLVDLIEEHLT